MLTWQIPYTDYLSLQVNLLYKNPEPYKVPTVGP